MRDTTRMVTNCSTHNQVLWKRFKRQSLLQVFVELGILFMIIFSYFPMFGIIMAFKDYRIASVKGIFISWVGLRTCLNLFTIAGLLILFGTDYIHESKGQKEMGQFIDCRSHASDYDFGMFGKRRRFGEHGRKHVK